MLKEKEKMLTVPEIANYMGVTKKTVISWIENGKLIAFRLDRTFRIKEENFKSFIANNSNE